MVQGQGGAGPLQRLSRNVRITSDVIALPANISVLSDRPFLISYALLAINSGPDLGLLNPPYCFVLPTMESLNDCARELKSLVVDLNTLQYG